jgi:hypothetical protein
VNKVSALALVCAALALGEAAQAQSVTPMRGVTKSFTDVFAVRLTVGNPYERAVNFEVRVYDENFEPVEAFVSQPVIRIGARDTKQVTVRVPFMGQGQRKVRVCAEGLFGMQNKSTVRTQVCGRFLGQLVGS